MGRQSQYPVKRDEIVRAVKQLSLAKQGRPPTIRELATETHTSIGTLHAYIGRLVEEGYITWRPRAHRSIKLTDKGHRLADTPLPF